MGARRAIERLPPYPSLLLLGIPWLIVESTKLAALAFSGEGHRLSGAGFLVCAHGAGAMGTERLFAIVNRSCFGYRGLRGSGDISAASTRDCAPKYSWRVPTIVEP